MMFWSNLLAYQLVWFITVIGAGHGKAWPAIAATVVFVGWQLCVSGHRRADMRLLLIAVVLGLLLDGTLAASGWAHYATPAPALPQGGAPVWILALWAAFAMTLNHSVAYLRGRPWLALVLGAIGGPLAYLSAARGWQAIVFEPPAWRGVLWLAMGWAVALPLLVTLARRWTRGPNPMPDRSSKKEPTP
jgi:hypothetical protein